MTDELQAFRDQLRAAGQPYSLWGARTVGIAFGLLVLIQILGLTQPKWLLQFGLLVFVVCLAVMAAGWVMLIIAFVRRRRWAASHRPIEPALPQQP